MAPAYDLCSPSGNCAGESWRYAQARGTTHRRQSSNTRPVHGIVPRDSLSRLQEFYRRVQQDNSGSTHVHSGFDTILLCLDCIWKALPRLHLDCTRLHRDSLLHYQMRSSLSYKLSLSPARDAHSHIKGRYGLLAETNSVPSVQRENTDSTYAAGRTAAGRMAFGDHVQNQENMLKRTEN